MSKHQRNRAEKRERLMRSGFEAFTEAGYDNTTVSDIVRRAGMTPSTFYNYFRDKEALLSDILEDLAQAMVASMAAARKSPAGVEEFYAAVTHSMFSFLIAYPDAGLFLKRNLSLVRSIVDHPALDPVHEAVQEDLRGFVSRGTIGPMDVDYAASVMRASIAELAIAMLSRTPPDLEKAVEFATKMISGALRAIGTAESSA